MRRLEGMFPGRGEEWSGSVWYLMMLDGHTVCGDAAGMAAVLVCREVEEEAEKQEVEADGGGGIDVRICRDRPELISGLIWSGLGGKGCRLKSQKGGTGIRQMSRCGSQVDMRQDTWYYGNGMETWRQRLIV